MSKTLRTRERVNPNWSILAVLIAVLAGSLFHPINVLAQSGAGSIQGTIQDPSAAAVPGCAVRVVNQKTGVAFETTSNSAGFYSVPGLFVGSYTITFSAPGMKTYKTELTLQDAQNAILNPTLTVGDVTEQVVVTGDAFQQVTYDSGTVSTHLDVTRIDQLPQNGRNLLGLAAATTPGLEGNGTRANGLMQEGLEYTQDGAPMTNRNFGGVSNSSQATLPDPDSVQEVKIETLNSSAQFATPATAIITTKSGTNQFHGSLFETHRNNAIGIARARQDPADFAAPHLIRNEFGASVGGPIIVPKLYNGTSRSFFFFAYERFSLRRAANQLVYVPTVAMRNGDFSGLVNAQGIPITLYDPNTTQGSDFRRTPFPNNQIPLERRSPLATALYAATPLPTSADNPLIRPNFTDVNHITHTVPNSTFRLDHVFDQNNRVYLRFTHIDQSERSLRNYPEASPANIAGGGLPAGATGYEATPIQTTSAALGYTHLFSSTFFSETIVSQQWQRMYVEGGGDVNQNYERLLGLPNNFNQTGFPTIGANLIMPYGGSQFNYGMSQILTTIDENMTKIWGNHQFAFGGRYRHERFGYLPDRSADTIAFTNQATALYDPSTGANYGAMPYTGFADADFFLGAASSYSQVKNAPFGRFREQEIDFYFQDNFRVNSKLTLNLGLRWEMHPAPHTEDGILPSFDLKNNAVVLPNPLQFYVDKGYTTQAIITNMQNLGVKFLTPEQAGIPKAGIFNSMANFNPRIGFAYTPFSKWGSVIRGGYGDYIYPVPIRNSVRVPIASLPFRAPYSRSYTSAAQSPDGLGLPNYLLRSPQSVIAGLNSASVVDTNSTNALLPGIALNTLDPYYPPARVKQANLTIEQPIKGSVLRITYLFTHGSNLDQNYQFNINPSAYVWHTRTGEPLPTGRYASTATRPYDQRIWGTNVISTKYGFSNNSALQVNFQRRFDKGYAFQIFYVYSRAFRVGGNTFRDNILYPAAVFAPGIIPEGLETGTLERPSRELNRWQNYREDIDIPKHHIRFNGVVDMPFGKGRRLLRSSNRLVDVLIGGYQMAFTGEVRSQSFRLGATNWGPTSEVKLYKSSVPIKDCRSGVCHDAYMWFNGYIAPRLINAPNGLMGLPADYVPYQTPINNNPDMANFGTNNVTVPLSNGKSVVTAYNPGPTGVNPFSHTVLPGPFNYIADISLYKTFSITENVKLRFNIDAFNAFNIQGRRNPNTEGGFATDGIQSLQMSYWTPRQVQFSVRLSF
jgi:Carboxypeptidase regulatory-like domain